MYKQAKISIQKENHGCMFVSVSNCSVATEPLCINLWHPHSPKHMVCIKHLDQIFRKNEIEHLQSSWVSIQCISTTMLKKKVHYFLSQKKICTLRQRNQIYDIIIMWLSQGLFLPQNDQGAINYFVKFCEINAVQMIPNPLCSRHHKMMPIFLSWLFAIIFDDDSESNAIEYTD